MPVRQQSDLAKCSFTAKPELAEDPQKGHRYNAACAAARAGCGQGEDAADLDEAARRRWRNRVLDWLRADLAARAKALEANTTQTRDEVRQTLQHWQGDPDLASLRDGDSLAKLPEEEWTAWRALWDEVEAVLKRAEGPDSPKKDDSRSETGAAGPTGATPLLT